ncbi:MAG: aldo/keto reductase [Lachnospiraceae bacterium]|nr:aldo/keto reductase [Lachnospiraceae bacterium]
MNIENLLEVPKLGFGLMRLPKKDGKIDIETSCRMVDNCLANGFYYFDTAYVYDAGDSECAVKEILTSRYPREKFCLATKLPAWELKEKEDRDKIFETQLERTGAGYFDFYLLHALSKENIGIYDKLDCFEWLKEKKEQGLIRHAGFSFHDTPELLDEILTAHPEVEFVQLQINYADWENKTVQSRGIYEIAKKHGKPIIVMEPVKGGNLANLTEQIGSGLKKARPEASYASWALRFVASHEGLLTILSGMSDESQMADNIATMKDFEPLTQEEAQLIAEVTERLNQIPTVGCTNCRYCVEGCPENIWIPDLIKHLNTCRVYGYNDGVGRNYGMLLKDGSGKPSSCAQCGQCESVCPQHISIIEIMEEAAKVLER